MILLGSENISTRRDFLLAKHVFIAMNYSADGDAQKVANLRDVPPYACTAERQTHACVLTHKDHCRKTTTETHGLLARLGGCVELYSVLCLAVFHGA